PNTAHQTSDIGHRTSNTQRRTSGIAAPVAAPPAQRDAKQTAPRSPSPHPPYERLSTRNTADTRL
ncbi:hypothetical protein, partial [Burkholderia pseudomallei]|uniref:hypothetical protein n=1 Tax=Burkholderia pseudomallei TaxID=28450 RepID=UPI001CA5281A